MTLHVIFEKVIILMFALLFSEKYFSTSVNNQGGSTSVKYRLLTKHRFLG